MSRRFTPWACRACGRKGNARHDATLTVRAIDVAVASSHAEKAPLCAQKNGHAYVALVWTDLPASAEVDATVKAG